MAGIRTPYLKFIADFVFRFFWFQNSSKEVGRAWPPGAENRIS